MNAPVPVPSVPRPGRGRRKARIGLALGSGAARGWAHLGVVRALAEAGVRPDVVAGCSVGALVGGCLAAGRLDELEAFALSLNGYFFALPFVNSVFRDSISEVFWYFLRWGKYC